MPLLPKPSLKFFFETSKFRRISIFFLKILIFSKLTGQVKPYGSGAGIASSTFCYIYSNLQYSGQEILCVFSSITMPNMVNSIKKCIGLSFCAGPSLSGLATVSVWQSCGKPSTWFPHGGLVECAHTNKKYFFKKIKNLKIF